MKGCRPLSEVESEKVLAALAHGADPLRDRALFLLGTRTGFRISELLSLRVGDVLQNGNYVSEVYIARRNIKKKREGRAMWLHEEAKDAVKALVAVLGTDPATFLFQSRKGSNQVIKRQSAWRVLRRAYAACGLEGKLATHTMRKTFAKRMKELCGNDLTKLQKLLGHAEITSTMRYIEVDEADLKAMVLKK